MIRTAMYRLDMQSALAMVALAACAPTNEMHPPREPVLATHANANEASGAPLGGTPGRAPEGRPLQTGLASWYGRLFAGKKTANGERFDPSGYTAAHRTLKMGTWVEVRRPETGRSVRVRINDRGPNGHAANRIIDLAQRAAEDLDIVREGVVRVELRVVDGP